MGSVRRASQPSAEPIITIAEVPGAFRTYCWCELHVLIWEAAPTPNTVAMLTNALQRHTCRGGNPYSSVALLITERADLIPDAAARRELVAMKQRHPVKFMAVIIEHQGFFASTVRAVITSLTTLMMKRGTVRMMRSMDQAASWLSVVHAPTIGPLRSEDIRCVLEELRLR